MKTKTVYICSNCGAEHARWAGRCTACGQWDTLEEKEISKKKGVAKSAGIAAEPAVPIKLSEIDTEKTDRFLTNISEFDRTLGGGIIPGSLVLVGGDPGIGKSTLMLQMCSKISGASALYITGEESLGQIYRRAERISDVNRDMLCLAETNLEKILLQIRDGKYDVVVTDSIQSIKSDYVEAPPGSLMQLRECSQALMNEAKRNNTAIFLIGHVTKDGAIAGPKVLEHLVDTVLFFEGEKNYSYRILRSVKNRFGSTNEIGIFEMTSTGLKEVLNPSEIFLNLNNTGESGIAISAAMEGSMPLLLEVQALVTSTGYGTPQRSANGFDTRRMQMLLAVLEKRLGLTFSSCDVFVNITGGFSVNDPGVDLAVAAALISSYRDVPIFEKTALIGEIGLTGEIRNVSNLVKRVNEIEKLGFKKVITPITAKDFDTQKFNIEIIESGKISLAVSGFIA